MSVAESSLWGFTIKAGIFDLETEALLASAIQGKTELEIYREKLHHLQQKFLHEMKPESDPVKKANALFTWLWAGIPNRYQPRGNFSLKDVIDAQTAKEGTGVGNCLGLTVLYNCLLERMSIQAGALHLEDAFGMGPHVLSLLWREGSTIDIENILPDGFDYKGHLINPSRRRWGDRELVADIYNSLGSQCFEKGEWTEALKKYEKAVRLNPHYEKARLNKAILSDKMRREEVS